MRIGELAKQTGASVRSLRYYEQRELLTSYRSTSGQRHYADNEVERVLFLKRLYAAGLTSRTILEVLPCTTSPSAQNSDAAFARLTEERDRLNNHIEDLAKTCDALDALILGNRRHRATVEDHESTSNTKS